MITKTWLKHQWSRVRYFLKHGKDDYGKEGFTQLMYKGIPLRLDDSVPPGKVRYEHVDGSFREIDLVTGKVTVISHGISKDIKPTRRPNKDK